MAKNSFSPAMIDRLGKGSLAVPNAPGLTIEATPGGKKVWRFRRRISKTEDILKATLGPFPAYSIPQAREWANDLAEQCARGENPRLKMDAEATRLAMTVDRAHELYNAACRRTDRKKVLREGTLRNKEDLYDLAKPFIGSKPISDVTDDDLWEIVEAKAMTHPPRANRLASELKTFFKWCCSRDGKMAGVGLTVDPAISLESGRWAESVRTRNLLDHEIELLFIVLADSEALVEHYPVSHKAQDRVEDRCRVYRRAILLLLLSGCRIDEIVKAPSSHYQNGIFTVPASVAKNGLKHTVPLAPWGRSLAQTNAKWLIPSWKIDGPMAAGWYKVFDRIIDRMSELNGALIEPFRPHDLRRTFRTYLGDEEISKDRAKALMNHKKENLDYIYNQATLDRQKAETLAAWEEKLIGIARAAGVADRLYVPSV